MRNNLIFIISVLLILITCAFIGNFINSKKKIEKNQANKEFEQYINKELYGTDVVTIINKAVNNNNKYNIHKDENEYYIDNNENSIIVELIMITNEEKETTKTYRMEKINKVGITEFIKNFNTEKFKIKEIKYHNKTGRISYILLEEK